MTTIENITKLVADMEAGYLAQIEQLKGSNIALETVEQFLMSHGMTLPELADKLGYTIVKEDKKDDKKSKKTDE